MLVSRQPFARLLATVTKAVPSRNTIPVLATLRLVAADGKMTATATDLDMEIAGSIDAEGDFAACIDAKLLTGIISKLSGDDIDLTADGATATLKAGRSKFKLETLPVSDFPTLEHGTFTAEFEADLAALFAPIHFAMSDEQTRHYLCGIYLQPDAATATDGHRMATRKFEALGTFEPVIIPRWLVPILPAGNVKVRLSSGKIRLATESVTITSRLVEGTYPDYEHVIPKSNDKIVSFDADDLRAASARVAMISSERGRAVKLTIGTEGIRLWAHGAGEAEDSVAGEYDGDPVEVGLNAQYLADILTAMPDGLCRMALADPGSPVLFTSPANDALRVVGMPMRI